MMNDVKMILTVFLSFSIFGVVVGLFPASFYPNTYNYSPQVPAYYEGLDIAAYSDTINFTIDHTTFTASALVPGYREHTFDLGGVYWVMYADSGYSQVRLGVRNYLGIFWISTDYLQFKADLINRGDLLTGSEMNQDFTGNETWVQYRMYLPSRPEIGCDVNIGFNTSLYGSPSEALANEALTVYIGMGIDDVLTTINAWQIVASFFFFNPPNIHPLVNGVIKIVTWSLVGIALILFVGRFIPFIQGGSA